MAKPKVLVEVEGGVATCTTRGEVAVCVVDYDALQAGDEAKIPESFYTAFPGLREAVANAIHNREHRSTSWQDF